MHSLDGANGMLRLTTSKPSFEIEATLRYLLTSRTLVSFFDGRVPWRKWAAVRRRSEHSDLVESHAALLVKGSLDVPSKMSLVVMWRTTESSCWFMKVQIWQVGSSQSGAFRLAKSEGRMAWPEMCLMEAWKRLAVDKNVETLGLAENSPLYSFSYAWTQGLLSVSIQAGKVDCIK